MKRSVKIGIGGLVAATLMSACGGVTPTEEQSRAVCDAMSANGQVLLKEYGPVTDPVRLARGVLSTLGVDEADAYDVIVASVEQRCPEYRRLL